MLFQNIERLISSKLKNQSFDALAIGVIDFSALSFESKQYLLQSGKISEKSSPWCFDLASLTKPLVLSVSYLAHADLFDDSSELLLNHRAGLPSGGRLSGHSWRDKVLSFTIKDSPTLYSDYSALRLMLELEKRTQKSVRSFCAPLWDADVCFWKEIKNPENCPVTGIRHGKPIQGEVHDDNAFVINEFCSHAGLFSTIEGVCRTLINLEKKLKILKKMDEAFKQYGEGHPRFIHGWDTVTDLENTLAGLGASRKTFGHLGFTGTSLWVDIVKKKGVVILSNATQFAFYDKAILNELRREVGHLVWKQV